MKNRQSISSFLVKGFFRMFGLTVVKYSTLEKLVNTKKLLVRNNEILEFVQYIQPTAIPSVLKLITFSKSQFQQDLFVLLTLQFKKGGYFVEFGGTNGVDMSNSWLLEKKFQWNGIVAEPGTQWQKDLQNNRECYVSQKCVWRESGKKLLFNESKGGGYSTIDSFSRHDRHFGERIKGKKYYVESISLTDLLVEAKAPTKIDYLSIDTEGSEYDILVCFDFEKWDVSIVSVEHNFTKNREKLKALMESKGFVRVLSDLSQVDDWYVKPELMPHVHNTFIVSR
jgi:FkbM family methyltransferase